MIYFLIFHYSIDHEVVKNVPKCSTMSPAKGFKRTKDKQTTVWYTYDIKFKVSFIRKFKCENVC